MGSLLSRVTSTAQLLPPRTFLYAREKWGKSSLFTHAPGAIYFMTRGETGLVELIAGGRVPPTAHFEYDEQEPPTWETLRTAVRELIDEEHEYRYLVIDTCNGAEILCQDYVRRRFFKNSQAKFANYGKGWEECRLEWSDLLQDLDALRAKRKMAIVFLAHTQVKKFDDPTAEESYDKYRPACADKLWDLTHRWSDIICFGHFEPQVYETEGGKTKARNQVKRVLCFDQSPLYEAGNRSGLSGNIDVGNGAARAFKEFAGAIEAAQKNAPKPRTWAKDEFSALLTRKGKGWRNALIWIDKAYGTKHVESKSDFAAVSAEHVSLYAASLSTLPDAPPPANPPATPPTPPPPPPVPAPTPQDVPGTTPGVPGVPQIGPQPSQAPAANSDGEGEDRSDPTKTTAAAPTGSAPSAEKEKASASAAPTPATAATEPAPRTMPAAERRLTAPPSPGADVPVICNMLHELEVSWTQVRDRHEGRGEEIADACGIFGTPGMVIPDLGLSVRNQLRTHLEALVAEKRAKKAKKEAKKEANKTRKEAVAS